MSWGAVIGAVGAIGGGILGSKKSGGGGGLPSWLKDPYRQLTGGVSKLPMQQYFPGQTSIGELPSETAAFGSRNAYNQGMFGQGGLFGDVMGNASNQLGGNTATGFLSNTLSPYAASSIFNSFGQGPGTIGNYQQDPFRFGQAGGLDATGAFQSALSGTPDYQGVQGAIEAANAPLLRQFNEQLIPGLNQNATFLNNSTGGIKALNKAIPELGQRMSENALSITEGERQRALGAQERAANTVAQGGMSGYGMGLQNANLGLQSDIARAGLGSQFRSDVLGLGGLAGQTSGQQDMSAARMAAMFPSLYQTGLQPSQDDANYGAFQRMLAENKLQGDIGRFNFYQNEPYNRYGFQAGIYSQLAGGAAQPPQGSSALGGLGGAITGLGLGQQIASMFGNRGGVPMVNQPNLGAINIPFPNQNWTNGMGNFGITG